VPILRIGRQVPAIELAALLAALRAEASPAAQTATDPITAARAALGLRRRGAR
jgi:hypothetical protein